MASQSSATSRGQPREAACRIRTGGRHHYGTARISRGFRAATPPHERGRRSRPAAGRRRPAGRAQPTLVESGSLRADPHIAHAIRTIRGSAPSSTLIRQCPSRSLEWGCGRKADTLGIRQLPARIAPGPEPGSCARQPATPLGAAGPASNRLFARLFAKAGQNAPRRWQRGGLLRCRNGNAESSKGLADVIFCRLRKSRVAAKNLGSY